MPERPADGDTLDYRDFFEHAPIGLHVIGADGAVLRANQAELDILGYRREDYVGQPLARFHADADAYATLWRRLSAGETVVGWYVRMRCGDGAVKHVVLSANGVRRDGRFLYARGLIRDISAQIAMERQLALLVSVGRSLTRTLNADVVWRGLAQSAHELLQATNVVLYRVESETGDLVAIQNAGEVRDVRGLRIPRGEAVAGRAAIERRAVFSAAMLDDPAIHLGPDTRARLGALPHRAALGVPMMIDGEVVGVVGVGAPAGRAFTPVEISVVESLADYAAIALRNARVVADEQRTRADAERARGEAEAANRAKDEFLAMLGHELRNPLAAIVNAGALLEQAGGDAAIASRARGVVQRQAAHLTRLVDDLLDVGRVTMGKIALDRAPVDLAGLVRGATDAFREAGRAAGRRLDVTAAPVWVDGDETRLEQIVVNLLANAAKFTREGGAIEVRVRADGAEAVVEVRDDGVGIPADMLPRVFDLFVQADATLDRSRGGLGIGLTLAQRLARLHGGSLEAASAGLGQGSVFTVRLPRIAPPPRLDAAPRAAVPAGRRRILLVEDNADTREVTRLVLELAGHEVHEAADGPSGLAALLRLRPDIAIVDIGLPGLDGYDVARQVRSHPAAADVLLVALTGYGQREDRERALNAGFDMQLVKPVDPLRLADILARAQQRLEARPQRP